MSIPLAHGKEATIFTTIRAFLVRREEIEASGSETERVCLKGFDALGVLVPAYLEAIGDVPLIPGEVTEIDEQGSVSEAAPGEEAEDTLPF